MNIVFFLAMPKLPIHIPLPCQPELDFLNHRLIYSHYYSLDFVEEICWFLRHPIAFNLPIHTRLQSLLYQYLTIFEFCLA